MWLDLGEYRGPGHFHAFVMYCVQRTRQRAITTSYRTYVTDSLNNIPQSKYMQQRWADLLVEHEEIDVDATIERVMRGLEAQ